MKVFILELHAAQDFAILQSTTYNLIKGSKFNINDLKKEFKDKGLDRKDFLNDLKAQMLTAHEYYKLLKILEPFMLNEIEKVKEDVDKNEKVKNE